MAAVEGYNHIVMAYGEKSSGKTHTLVGPHWEESIRNNA